MRPQLYTCALVDENGAVLQVTRISAADAIDAGRYAETLASSFGGDVSVEMRLSDTQGNNGGA